MLSVIKKTDAFTYPVTLVLKFKCCIKIKVLKVNTFILILFMWN